MTSQANLDLLSIYGVNRFARTVTGSVEKCVNEALRRGTMLQRAPCDIDSLLFLVV